MSVRRCCKWERPDRFRKPVEYLRNIGGRGSFGSFSRHCLSLILNFTLALLGIVVAFALDLFALILRIFKYLLVLPLGPWLLQSALCYSLSFAKIPLMALPDPFYCVLPYSNYLKACNVTATVELSLNRSNVTQLDIPGLLDVHRNVLSQSASLSAYGIYSLSDEIYLSQNSFELVRLQAKDFRLQTKDIRTRTGIDTLNSVINIYIDRANATSFAMHSLARDTEYSISKFVFPFFLADHSYS